MLMLSLIKEAIKQYHNNLLTKYQKEKDKDSKFDVYKEMATMYVKLFECTYFTIFTQLRKDSNNFDFS